MKTPPLPALSTLLEPPSWLNNVGNLDRSACFEIRLKEIRQLAGCVTVRQGRRLHSHKRVRDTKQKVRGLPDEKAAVNGQGRVATGVYELSMHDLLRVADLRVPRAQAGDHRSARANALNDRRRNRIHKELHGGVGDGRVRDERGQPRWKTNVRGIPRAERDEPLPADRLYTNAWPNLLGHGKVLGVAADWTQPVRLEKWVYGGGVQGSVLSGATDSGADAGGAIVRVDDGRLRDSHRCEGMDRHGRLRSQSLTSLSVAPVDSEAAGKRALLPKYYLVCPGVLPDGRTAAARRAYRERGQCTPKKIDMRAGHAMTLVRPAGIGDDQRLAALSDAPLGAKRVGCPQRVRMLLLPLCWQEEYDDAMFAQRWIAGLTDHQRSVAAKEVARLVWRYGMLFSPRTMLCRQCLDAKKGAHPETKRRGARKRNYAWKFNPITKHRKRGLVC